MKTLLILGAVGTMSASAPIQLVSQSVSDDREENNEYITERFISTSEKKNSHSSFWVDLEATKKGKQEYLERLKREEEYKKWYESSSHVEDTQIANNYNSIIGLYGDDKKDTYAKQSDQESITKNMAVDKTEEKQKLKKDTWTWVESDIPDFSMDFDSLDKKTRFLRDNSDFDINTEISSNVYNNKKKWSKDGGKYAAFESVQKSLKLLGHNTDTQIHGYDDEEHGRNERTSVEVQEKWINKGDHVTLEIKTRYGVRLHWASGSNVNHAAVNKGRHTTISFGKKEKGKILSMGITNTFPSVFSTAINSTNPISITSLEDKSTKLATSYETPFINTIVMNAVTFTLSPLGKPTPSFIFSIWMPFSGLVNDLNLRLVNPLQTRGVLNHISTENTGRVEYTNLGTGTGQSSTTALVIDKLPHVWTYTFSVAYTHGGKLDGK